MFSGYIWCRSQGTDCTWSLKVQTCQHHLWLPLIHPVTIAPEALFKVRPGPSVSTWTVLCSCFWLCVLEAAQTYVTGNLISSFVSQMDLGPILYECLSPVLSWSLFPHLSSWINLKPEAWVHLVLWSPGGWRIPSSAWPALGAVRLCLVGESTALPALGSPLSSLMEHLLLLLTVNLAMARIPGPRWNKTSGAIGSCEQFL